MAHTFAELGKGTMARARDNRFKSGRNLGHTPFTTSTSGGRLSPVGVVLGPLRRV